MGFVSNLEFTRVNTKSTKLFLMLKFSIHKVYDVGLLRTGFLASPIGMGAQASLT